MPNQSQLSIWKRFFLTNKDLDSLNLHMEKIKKASSHSSTFPKSFEEISKNAGVSFLILDSTETHLQILHHGHVLGGNWNYPTKKLVAVLGCDSEAKPVQIVQKSIKNMKEKSFPFSDLRANIDNEDQFAQLDVPKVDFLFKNIIPIPNFLTKIFFQLDSTTPISVAKAFIERFSKTPVLDTTIDSSSASIETPTDTTKDIEKSSSPPDLKKGTTENSLLILDTLREVDILHVIQFCHLCVLGKVSPVLYSLSTDAEITNWFKSISWSLSTKKLAFNKRQNPSTPDSDSDSGVSRSDNKISKKDHYLINTIIKLHDTMDKSSKSKEEKEPGFNRLESHRKKLILNASALPLFTKAADNPTKFYTSFLSKKSQFKAKDMLLHRFHSDKISFNPNSTFIMNLWNSEFFWILPDSPLGISIFYCPETKSLNSYELEREYNLALLDEVDASDIEKLAKQKNSLPTKLMELVWTAQNFLAVLSLCFGSSSHSASFIQGWVDHMYDNRLLYSSLQSSDPYFYVKVMFMIDNALQCHWRSCSSVVDRHSVNDNILQMSDIQDSILRLNFSQMLPKSISDKVQLMMNVNKDDRDKGNGLGKNGKRLPGALQDNTRINKI
jgi:hypothetical protein